MAGVGGGQGLVAGLGGDGAVAAGSANEFLGIQDFDPLRFGWSHGFAAACRRARVGFSFGCAIDARVREAVEVLNAGGGWYPAFEADGGIHDGAWVAEATGLVALSAWPTGTRLILRKELPHPGAQLRFTDSDGHRVAGFLTDTAAGVVPGQLAGLTVPPPTRPRRGPDPPSQGHRLRISRSLLRRQCSLARNHHGRNRSGGMGETDRFTDQPDLAR